MAGGRFRAGELRSHADQGDRLHLGLIGAEQVQPVKIGSQPGQAVLAQQTIDPVGLKAAPAERHAAGLLQGDGRTGQAEPALRHRIEPAGQIGGIARLHQVERRNMGLGLGGEIGPGDGFDPFAGVGLTFGGLFQLRQGGPAELHDIAPMRLETDLLQQGAVVEQGLGVGLQPGADLRPVGLGRRKLRKEVRLAAQRPLLEVTLQDGLARLAPVRQEGIKPLVG